MQKQQKVHIRIPTMVAAAYIMLSIILIPWTMYLSVTLPERHVFRHWDVSWVGLDIAIFISLLITGILVNIKSRWVAIASTIAGSLLLADAWFDIVSGRGLELREAIVLAALFEIPLAIISFSIAVRVLLHNIE